MKLKNLSLLTVALPLSNLVNVNAYLTEEEVKVEREKINAEFLKQNGDKIDALSIFDISKAKVTYKD